jgi:hypothetical protein
MKLFFAILTVAAISLSFIAPANAWYCSARANTGQWGWGSSGWLGTARAIAMRECVVRTPSYGTCYIMYCR